MKRVIHTPGTEINGIKFIQEIEPKRTRGNIFRMGEFECGCGRIFTCIIQSVMSGNTKSCGCYSLQSKSERFKTHGLRADPTYNVWRGIKTRCYNKNRVDYKYYGGAGVRLSEEFHVFLVFHEYVTNLPDYENRTELKLTIDRINVRLNYERGNLRWATRKQQSLNQRRNT